MGNSDKRIERVRTKPIRVYLEDWITVDKIAGEDRPIKEGFREIMEEWEEYRDIEEYEEIKEEL